MKIFLLLFLYFLHSSFIFNTYCQTTDTSSINSDHKNLFKDSSIKDAQKSENLHPSNPSCKSLILPATLISYGVIALNSNRLRRFDLTIKDAIKERNPYFKSNVDDYLQYTPVAAVYALNAFGIKGRNNFVDRSIIYGLTAMVTGATVTGIKAWAQVTRPDGSAVNSFPSGHTTTAFAAAEFLHQEYKHKSVWYSIAGYSCAVATGVLRTYNQKHFFSDIVCGAGLGIMSTKIIYMIYPSLKRKFSKHKR